MIVKTCMRFGSTFKKEIENASKTLEFYMTIESLNWLQ